MFRTSFYIAICIGFPVLMLLGLAETLSPLVADTSAAIETSTLAEIDDAYTFVGPPAPPPPPPLPPKCIDSVEDLPEAPYLDKDDPRLFSDDPVIVVLKSQRKAMVFRNGVISRQDYPRGNASCWKIALGVRKNKETGVNYHPVGAKQRRGDHKTPEGWYRTSDRPYSNYAPALNIHYPNKRDVRIGLRGGVISQEEHDAIMAQLNAGMNPPEVSPLGGRILFHGPEDGYDWTWGCVALSEGNNLKLRSITEPHNHKVWTLILP